MKIKSWKFYIPFILMPSCLFFIIFFFLLYNDQLKQQKENFSNTNLQQATTLITFLYQKETYLETAANTLTLYKDRPDIQKEIMDKALSSNDVFEEMYLVSKNGVVIESSDPAVVSYKVKDMEEFNRYKQIKKTFTSEIINVSETGKYETNIIYVPILNKSNEIEYVLYTTINLEGLADNILHAELNEFVLLNEFGTPVVGSVEILSGKKRNHYKVFDNKWKLYYKIPDLKKRKILSCIAFSFALSFLFFHLLYTIIYIREIKYTESLKQLKLMEAFAASTSHEIKTPLTEIKGFVGILEQKSKVKEDKMYFDIIHKGIERINEISSEFLVLGKPIYIEKKDFLLQEAVAESLSTLYELAKRNNIIIEQDIEKEDIIFTGNDKHITQILLNLGKNAIEASSLGKVIKFTVKRITEENILIKVEDNGIGIKNEDLKSLYSPFHTTKETGTGLGLIICKKIIESYKGTIDIESTFNQGTTVTIVLPIKKS